MEFTKLVLSDLKRDDRAMQDSEKRRCFLVVQNNSPYSCGIFDTLELAESAIHQAILEYDDNHEIGSSIWVQNGTKNVYLRVPWETLKSFPFQNIVHNARYDVKYQIFCYTLNTLISHNPQRCF